jgi:formylglycine-generating enzyme required for sulfatase activity
METSLTSRLKAHSDIIIKLKQAMAAVWAAFFFLSVLSGFAAAQSDAAVRVTGRGETPFEARQDAVRQALQQKVDQLVISQQIVEGDRLTLDKISSTMNGFVNQFTPIRRYEDKALYFVEADVVVSESRIENFIGSVKGARTNVNSENILAGVQAEKLAREARSEMIRSLFLGFPADVMEASSPSFKINDNNPELINFQLEARWAPGFLKTIEEGLRALDARHVDCRTTDYFRDCEIGYPTNSLTVCLTDSDLTYAKDRDRFRQEPVDCYTISPVDLSVLKSVSSEGFFKFEAALLSGGRLLGTGSSENGFVAKEEKENGSSHLTILLDKRPVLVGGSLPAESFAGVLSVDAIPLVRAHDVYMKYLFSASDIGTEHPLRLYKLVFDLLRERSFAALGADVSGKKVAGEVFQDALEGGGQGPEMIVVPAGSINIDQRTVTIDYPLAIGRYEVTWTEYQACISEGACRIQPQDDGFGLGKNPVTDVTWIKARAYADWLSIKTGHTYRLLSEAEWEYAARGGSEARWSFGSDERRLGNFVWFESNSSSRTQPVGGKTANAFGLHDMDGNVWELVEDCYSLDGEGPPSDGSAKTSDRGNVDCSHVIRGGSWASKSDAWASKSGSWRAPRSISDHGTRYRYPNLVDRYDSGGSATIGFRIARTLP